MNTDTDSMSEESVKVIQGRVAFRHTNDSTKPLGHGKKQECPALQTLFLYSNDLMILLMFATAIIDPYVMYTQNMSSLPCKEQFST